MRLGGYLDSAPCVFLVALADIPAGLVFSAKTTVFTYEGIKYRVDGVDPEAGTHTRLTTNLASR